MADEIGDNAAEDLKRLIERVERLNDEKKAIADDIKDVFSEAKANGYDTKVMRKMIAERKMERHAREEMWAMEETYRNALGLLMAD